MVNMKIISLSKELHQKHPSLLTAVFFILGFLFDIITLGRIDETSNFVGHFIYLIFLIYAFLILEKDLSLGKFKFLEEYKLDVFHFLAGGLLSAFALFFIKSSSISDSFLFIFMILILLIINEAPKFQQRGYVVKLALIQFCLTSFFIIYIPVIFKTYGSITFIVSTIISCFILPLFFKKITHRLEKPMNVISIFIGLFFFIGYFTNLIPPVPLSVKKIGVYHNVEKQNGEYRLFSETHPMKFWSQGDQDFHAQEGDQVYIFARIFAPVGLKSSIYIQWEKWNKVWQVSDKIQMSILGGNSWGYRAYAYKKNYTEGLWRAKILTENDKELGRVDFTVTKVDKEKRQWRIDIEKR